MSQKKSKSPDVDIVHMTPGARVRVRWSSSIRSFSQPSALSRSHPDPPNLPNLPDLLGHPDPPNHLGHHNHQCPDDD